MVPVGGSIANYDRSVLSHHQSFCCAGSSRPVYVPSLTVLMVARLASKVRAAALTFPLLLARKSRTAGTLSESSAGGLPPVRPSAAARSHAGLDAVPDGLPLPLGQGEEHVQHQAGGGTVVPGVQPLPHGADVYPLLVELLDGPESLAEVTGQAVDPRDHDDVAGLEQCSELLPLRSAHVPPRGDVAEDAVVSDACIIEDAALGGQAALALRPGDADVAKDRWVHSLAPHGWYSQTCASWGWAVAERGQNTWVPSILLPYVTTQRVNELHNEADSDHITPCICP